MALNREGVFSALSTYETHSDGNVLLLDGVHEPGSRNESPDNKFFRIYREQGGLLRTWFVGFGIAVPVLSFTNQYMTPNVSLHGHPGLLNCFFAGIALQVLPAFFNKHVMWVLYYGAVHPSFQKTSRHKWAEAISRWHGLNFAFDAATLVLFAIATGRLFTLLTQ